MQVEVSKEEAEMLLAFRRNEFVWPATTAPAKLLWEHVVEQTLLGTSFTLDDVFRPLTPDHKKARAACLISVWVHTPLRRAAIARIFQVDGKVVHYHTHKIAKAIHGA